MVDLSAIADPMFVDEVRFEPAPTSPTVDAMACLVEFDFDAEPRPGPSCDIGAFELEQ